MGKHSTYPNKAGVYKLTCSTNGKIYIGKTVSLSKRLNAHKNCKQRPSRMCYFQHAIIKYGWDSFIVEILEILEIVENFDKRRDNLTLLEKESFYIKLFDSTNKEKGYNICNYSTDGTGILRGPRSEETKRKIGQANRGNIISDDHKNKLRQFNLGKSHSEETKEKIRVGNLGKKHSEETKQKMKILRQARKDKLNRV